MAAGRLVSRDVLHSVRICRRLLFTCLMLLRSGREEMELEEAGGDEAGESER